MAAGAEIFAPFKDAMVYLAAAGVAVPLLKRFRIEPILGFMLAGAAIGPYGLGALAPAYAWVAWVTITDAKAIAGLAELGVVFLLFAIGIDLPIERLWRMRGLVFGLGALQIALTAPALGAAAWAWGLGPWASVVAGLAFALSSTAITLPLLVSARRFGTPTGQASFGVLLMQDVAFVPILILVGAVGASKGAETADDWVGPLILGVAAVAAVVFAGRVLATPALRAAARTGSRELFLAAVLLTAMASALALAFAGLSAALGALLAGMMLSDSEFRHQIEADLEPFKGLLLGLFFVSVGMSLDLGFVAGRWAEIGAGVALVFAVKAAVLGVLAPRFVRAPGAAAQIAFLLAHASEFTLILVGAAKAGGVIPAEEAQVLVAVAVVSMAFIPLADAAGRAAGRRLSAGAADLPEVEPDGTETVLIAGFGRVGRTIADFLDAEGVPWIALDADPEAVAAARAGGRRVYFGDATSVEVLERLGAGRARAIAVTLDGADKAERLAEAARAAWPSVPLYARAKDWAHATRLRRLGAVDVVPEAVEGGLQLAAKVLHGVGVPESAVLEIVDSQRARQRAAHDAEMS